MHLSRLLSIASTRGGTESIGKLVVRMQRERRQALATFIDEQCNAHSTLHKVLDPEHDDDRKCHPKKTALCSAPLPLVHRHFWFCRELIQAVRQAPTPKRSRLLTPPYDAARLGDVISILVEAGVDHREVALMLLDHELSDRDPRKPLRPDALAAKHSAVLTEASEHRKRLRNKRRRK